MKITTSRPSQFKSWCKVMCVRVYVFKGKKKLFYKINPVITLLLSLFLSWCVLLRLWRSRNGSSFGFFSFRIRNSEKYNTKTMKSVEADTIVWNGNLDCWDLFCTLKVIFTLLGAFPEPWGWNFSPLKAISEQFPLGADSEPWRWFLVHWALCLNPEDEF